MCTRTHARTHTNTQTKRTHARTHARTRLGQLPCDWRCVGHAAECARVRESGKRAGRARRHTASRSPRWSHDPETTNCASDWCTGLASFLAPLLSAPQVPAVSVCHRRASPNPGRRRCQQHHGRGVVHLVTEVDRLAPHFDGVYKRAMVAAYIVDIGTERDAHGTACMGAEGSASSNLGCS
jgi:hypothetical protein